MQTGPDIWTITGHGAARDPARFGLHTDLGIAVVSHGFGSFSGGALAAQLAADLFPTHLRRHAPQVPPWLGLVGATPQHVAKAAAAITDRIQAAWQLDDFYNGMGASLAAVILRPNEALVAHIGDCCVLRMRGAEVERLTNPHIHADVPHCLTRALGIPSTEVDVVVTPILDQDTFVLCSSAAARALEDDPADGVVARLDAAVTLSGGAYVIAVVHKTQSIGPLQRTATWSGREVKS